MSIDQCTCSCNCRMCTCERMLGTQSRRNARSSNSLLTLPPRWVGWDRLLSVATLRLVRPYTANPYTGNLGIYFGYRPVDLGTSECEENLLTVNTSIVCSNTRCFRFDTNRLSIFIFVIRHCFVRLLSRVLMYDALDCLVFLSIN